MGKTLMLDYIGEDFWSRPVYKDQYGKIWKDIGTFEYPSLHSSSNNDIDGEPDMPINQEYKFLSQPGLNEKRFEYQMLSRLESDCKYYLGNGGRHPKYLWAGNEADQIKKMKEIWKSFSGEEKPEWLTLEQIEKYEKEMMKG